MIAIEMHTKLLKLNKHLFFLKFIKQYFKTENDIRETTTYCYPKHNNGNNIRVAKY